MSLAPCPSCSRHVRIAEPVCPFCASSLALVEPARVRVERLGRAALFTVGAAVVVAGASGCAMYGGPPVYTNDAGNDAAILAMYGGPPIDSGANGDT
jgi:hypothetical protein